MRLVYDAAGLSPDVQTVDRLASLQLAMKRTGGELSLRNATTELRELLVLAGLADVLPVEPEGQAEEREEGLGAEEERELGDPPAGELEHL